MLYGETNVELGALKRWCDSLNESSILYPRDTPVYEILKRQLVLFKMLVSELKPGDDWRNTQGAISNAFMKSFFVSKRGAIWIGNFYESFIVPSDVATKKKIFQGYANTDSIGGVQLFNGENQVGSIGEKSDLIWSVFYDYFVVETELGELHHTLPNHEEFLTIQLWDVEGKTEEQIDAYINNILLKISIEKGMNFKRSFPDELWREYGEAGEYEIQVGADMLEPIPLAYMNCGMTCQDARMAYLHYYQVLEYFFVRAQNEQLISNLSAEGFIASGCIEDGVLRSVLKKYTNSLREVESLKLVLGKVCDVTELKTYIGSSPEKRFQYTEDVSISDKIKLNLDAPEAKIVSKLAERIYFFRCAIAHAKGDVDEYIALPEVSESLIIAELPLVKKLARKALHAWGK